MSGKALPLIALLVAAALPAGAGAVTIPPPIQPHPGTVIVTRTVTTGGRTIKASTHTYRDLILADFRSFWTKGLAGQALANRLVLYPVLDTWVGAQGCKQRYVIFGLRNTCAIKIRASHISYKMNQGYLSGRGGTTNAVTLTYTSRGNYLDAKYTLRKLDVRASTVRRAALGYDPTVRTYFDAVLKVTLAVPYRSLADSEINQPALPIGPLKIAAVSATVSNLRFVSSRKGPEAADVEGVIANLGNGSYGWGDCIGCEYLEGKPFPTWTPWLQSSLRRLMRAAVPTFSSFSTMNGFLNASQAAGARTSKLGYSSFDGVSLSASGAATLLIKGTSGVRVPIVVPRPSATPGHR